MAATGRADQRAPSPDRLKMAAEFGDRIHFSASTMEISDTGMKRLLHHAARLKDNPRQTVTLAAHTENLGSSSYNLALAEEEFSAVAGVLRTLGVRKAQIRRHTPRLAISTDACSTPACKESARYVEITYP